MDDEVCVIIMHNMWVSYMMGTGVEVSPVITPAQRESLLNGIAYRRKYPDATPEEMHANWMKYKLDTGWVWGSYKDENKKMHPDLLPWKDLPLVERNKDLVAFLAFDVARQISLKFQDDLLGDPTPFL